MTSLIVLSWAVCLVCAALTIRAYWMTREMEERVFSLESVHARQVAFWIEDARIVVVNCGAAPVFDVQTVLSTPAGSRGLGQRAVLESGQRISMSTQQVDVVHDRLWIQFRDVRGLVWQRDDQGRTRPVSVFAARAFAPWVRAG